MRLGVLTFRSGSNSSASSKGVSPQEEAYTPSAGVSSFTAQVKERATYVVAVATVRNVVSSRAALDQDLNPAKLTNAKEVIS
jgi:hypothetical protein